MSNTAQALKHIVVLIKQGYMIVNSVYTLYKVHVNACSKSQNVWSRVVYDFKFDEVMVVIVLAWYFGFTTSV